MGGGDFMVSTGLALAPSKSAAASEVAFSLIFQLKWEEVYEAARVAVALGPIFSISGFARPISISGGKATRNRYSTGGTVPDLRHRWEWEPIRNDPRFQRILAQRER
jgi:hypothetical protein